MRAGIETVRGQLRDIGRAVTPGQVGLDTEALRELVSRSQAEGHAGKSFLERRELRHSPCDVRRECLLPEARDRILANIQILTPDPAQIISQSSADRPPIPSPFSID